MSCLEKEPGTITSVSEKLVWSCLSSCLLSLSLVLCRLRGFFLPPFLTQCLNDDVKLLRVLLTEPRVDFELRTPKQDTGLHLAALYSSLEVSGVFVSLLRSEIYSVVNMYAMKRLLKLCSVFLLTGAQGFV